MTDSVPTGDESFWAFGFAIVSCIMPFAFLPGIVAVIGDLRRLMNLKPWATLEPSERQKSKNRASIWVDDGEFFVARQLRAAWDTLGKVVAGVRDPADTLALINVSARRPEVLSWLVIPRFLCVVIRPRLLLLYVWLVLLSSTMYAKLSFDPHAVLGLQSDASMADVKRAGRRLMRKYHPDVNSEESAKPIFANVKKAYKALVDPETFEKDAKDEPLTVGIALPTFLTDKDNEVFVLFGLIAVLFLVPGSIFAYMRATSIDVPDLLARIRARGDAVETMIRVSGIPEDPVLVDRRAERTEVLRIMKACGLLDDEEVSVREALASEVSVAELRKRSQAPERFAGRMTKSHGVDAEALRSLGTFFELYDGAPAAAVNAARQKRQESSDRLFVITADGAATGVRGGALGVDATTLRAVARTVDLVQKDAEEAITQLEHLMELQLRTNVSLKAADKIKKQHKEVSDAFAIMIADRGETSESSSPSGSLTESPVPQGKAGRQVTFRNRDFDVLLSAAEKRETAAIELAAEVRQLYARAAQLAAQAGALEELEQMDPQQLARLRRRR